MAVRSVGSEITTTTTTVKKFGVVSPGIQCVVDRTVGTLEYTSALRHLEIFLQSASRDELDAAEKFVSLRPQFEVLTDLTNPKPVPKRGLMWLVALARVELGGILATFTAIQNPFEAVGPTAWELPAYQMLLMEGAQTHYQSLMSDAYLKLLLSKKNHSDHLAYIRRLSLARSFLCAAARSHVNTLSQEDWTRLEMQDVEMVRMLRRIVQIMAGEEYVKKSTVVTERQFDNTPELKSGKALSQPFKFNSKMVLSSGSFGTAVERR